MKNLSEFINEGARGAANLHGVPGTDEHIKMFKKEYGDKTYTSGNKGSEFRRDFKKAFDIDVLVNLSFGTKLEKAGIFIETE